MNSPPTSRNHILWLAVPPLAWMVHFLASYLTIAIWCAKSAGTDATPVRLAIGGYTLLALILIGGIAYRSYRQHRHGNEELPHDDDTPGDQLRFIGYATLLLAILSVVATVFTALVVVFVGSCD